MIRENIDKFLRSACLSVIFSLAILLTIGLIKNVTISAAAQTITGTLSGVVIDENRAPLAAVLVRITHLNTGFTYAKRTDLAGNYRVDFLPAGEYSISAEKTDYLPTVIPRFVAEVNREKFIKPPPIQLFPILNSSITSSLSNPASTAEQIVQVNISDATLRGNATTSFLNALPLNGIRSFDTFALLIPGVAPPPLTSGSSGPGIGIGVGTAGQFSVNGQRARANNFTIDGSDNNDQDVGVRRQGFTITTSQIIESITEFQISTLLSDAEAGRNSGGQINVVTRAGNNQLHGELFDFFTNDKLNARDFFDLNGVDNPRKNSFTRNQLGGTAGFAIIPNRLQIFTSLEHISINRIQENNFAVPTRDQRSNALKTAAGISRLGRDILDLYPLPNNPGGPFLENTFTRILPASGQGTLFSIKTDYQFPFYERAATLSARYNFTDDKTRLPAIDNAINSSITARIRTQNLALSLNTEISAKLSNQLRISYGRTALGFDQVAGSPLLFQTSSIGQDVTGDGIADGRSGPIGRLLLAPYSPIGIDPGTFPQGRVNNTLQLADTVLFTSGRETWKFGFDLRRVQLNSFLERNYRAQIAFSSGLIKENNRPLDIADGVNFAALGLPSDIFQALALVPDSTLGLRFTELNLFINNQWRIKPNLTIEFGLRYERNSVPIDVNHRLEDSLTLKDSQLPQFDPAQPTSQVFLRALAAQRQFLAGRNKIYQGDQNNFAPRVSFAYDLSKHGRTSLRGGYGIFYDPLLGTLVSQSRNALPNFIPLNFGSSMLFGNILGANPVFLRFGPAGNIPLIQPGTINTIGISPASFVPLIGQLLQLGGFFTGSGFGAGITLPEKDLATAYTHQYSLSLERVFCKRFVGTLAFVGTNGKKLLRSRTPNGGQFTPVSVLINKGIDPIVLPLLKRPDLRLGAVTVFESTASSSYQALQASLTSKFSEKFQLQLGYTYAHAIDDVSDIFELAGSGVLAQDELNRGAGLRAERGDANFDLRHNFTAAWQAQLPARFDRSFWKGITLAGILTLQTGPPFTVNSSVDINFDGNLTDRLNTIAGLIVKDRGRTRISLLPGERFIDQLAAIDREHPQNGAIGRNSFRSAGVASLDLALSKSFTISDQQRMILRVEAFNIFNRSHFGIPVRVLEAPGFGAAHDTRLSPRLIQFALRYQF